MPPGRRASVVVPEVRTSALKDKKGEDSSSDVEGQLTTRTRISIANLPRQTDSKSQTVIESRGPRRAFHKNKLLRVRWLEEWEWYSTWRGTVLEHCWKSACLASVFAMIITVVDKAPDEYIPWHVEWDMLPWSVTMIPAAFLVVFRTQVSYSRYWEGRAFLSNVLDHSRALARTTLALTGKRPHSCPLIASVMGLLGALPVTVRWEVQGQSMRREPREIAGFVSDARVRRLLDAERPPFVIITWLTDVIAQLTLKYELDGHARTQLLTYVDGLQTTWMGMSKLTFTPIPFPYTHLSKMYVLIWLFTVPIGLLRLCGWFTPVVTFFMALGLFGLIQSGLEIEYPFGVGFNNFFLEDYEATLAHDIQWVGEHGVRDDEQEAQFGEDMESDGANSSSSSSTSRGSVAGSVRRRPSQLSRAGSMGRRRQSALSKKDTTTGPNPSEMILGGPLDDSGALAAPTNRKKSLADVSIASRTSTALCEVEAEDAPPASLSRAESAKKYLASPAALS
eukprot:NODE_446_length_1933_cov_47.045958_g439_i0.p1 GENE.NODE_446_length_1933_cov_47.045958_g439_i0~~NODE_446_length_1933_cov_47.045958_g439_i0.p1  ORF type:complete len:507 (-),score=36.98 NODE_446_length_1933_cov_47.045958_g439_i0:328-1848(-)